LCSAFLRSQSSVLSRLRFGRPSDAAHTLACVSLLVAHHTLVHASNPCNPSIWTVVSPTLLPASPRTQSPTSPRLPRPRSRTARPASTVCQPPSLPFSLSPPSLHLKPTCRRPATGHALVLLPGRVLQLPARRRGAHLLHRAIHQGPHHLVRPLPPLSISTRCSDLSSLPDGICICPPLLRARDRCAGIRRTGGTRSSWWAPVGCRPRTRPPSQRSPSPSACKRGSPARCSPPLSSSPPWLVHLPAPPLPFDTKKRVDHLWQAVDLIGSLIILGRVVVIWGEANECPLHFKTLA
jgi:hypothetical protein